MLLQKSFISRDVYGARARRAKRKAFLVLTRGQTSSHSYRRSIPSRRREIGDRVNTYKFDFGRIRAERPALVYGRIKSRASEVAARCIRARPPNARRRVFRARLRNVSASSYIEIRVIYIHISFISFETRPFAAALTIARVARAASTWALVGPRWREGSAVRRNHEIHPAAPPPPAPPLSPLSP